MQYAIRTGQLVKVTEIPEGYGFNGLDTWPNVNELSNSNVLVTDEQTVWLLLDADDEPEFVEGTEWELVDPNTGDFEDDGTAGFVVLPPDRQGLATVATYARI